MIEADIEDHFSIGVKLPNEEVMLPVNEALWSSIRISKHFNVFFFSFYLLYFLFEIYL